MKIPSLPCSRTRCEVTGVAASGGTATDGLRRARMPPATAIVPRRAYTSVATVRAGISARTRPVKPERPDGQRDAREADEQRSEAVPEARRRNPPVLDRDEEVHQEEEREDGSRDEQVGFHRLVSPLRRDDFSPHHFR